jgi:hypothetical protein
MVGEENVVFTNKRSSAAPGRDLSRGAILHAHEHMHMHICTYLKWDFAITTTFFLNHSYYYELTKKFAGSSLSSAPLRIRACKYHDMRTKNIAENYESLICSVQIVCSCCTKAPKPLGFRRRTWNEKKKTKKKHVFDHPRVKSGLEMLSLLTVFTTSTVP